MPSHGSPDPYYSSDSERDRSSRRHRRREERRDYSPSSVSSTRGHLSRRHTEFPLPSSSSGSHPRRRHRSRDRNVSPPAPPPLHRAYTEASAPPYQSYGTGSAAEYYEMASQNQHSKLPTKLPTEALITSFLTSMATRKKPYSSSNSVLRSVGKVVGGPKSLLAITLAEWVWKNYDVLLPVLQRGYEYLIAAVTVFMGYFKRKEQKINAQGGSSQPAGYVIGEVPEYGQQQYGYAGQVGRDRGVRDERRERRTRSEERGSKDRRGREDDGFLGDVDWKALVMKVGTRMVQEGLKRGMSERKNSYGSERR